MFVRTKPVLRWLSLSLVCVAGCAAPGEEETDSSGGAVNEGSGARLQGIELTEENCELETFLPAVALEGPDPLLCYPKGELRGKEGFLRAAADRYTIGRSRSLSQGRIGLSIVDERNWRQRLMAFGGQGDKPFFAVKEEPSVVSFQGKVEVSDDEPGQLTLTDASILALSSDLKVREETLRESFRGSALGAFHAGAKDLRGEALEPATCSKATVVLKAEAGGLLPNDDGTEFYVIPKVVAFYCDQ